VGIAAASAIPANQAAFVSLRFSGLSCDTGKTGANCESTVTNFTQYNTTMKVTLPSKQWTYYTIVVDPLTSNFTVRAKINTSAILPGEEMPSLSAYARKDNIPIVANQFNNSMPIYAFTANSVKTNATNVTTLELIAPAPVPGTWYVGILNTMSAGDITFDLNVPQPVACPLNMAGPTCSIAINDLTPVATSGVMTTGTAQTDTPVFYKVVIPEATGLSTLLVSVASTDGSPNPTLAISQGNVPWQNQSAVANCNLSPTRCSAVNAIQTPATPNTTWYIAVTGTKSDQPFGIWLSAICPGNCGGNGDCNKQTAVCTCDDDYEGLACTDESSSSGGFKTAYIVIIVVGSIVVVGIIIGVVMYLKNRAPSGYMPVK
jgi:hypothetical protein